MSDIVISFFQSRFKKEISEGNTHAQEINASQLPV
jgi:hypothetical protein